MRRGLRAVVAGLMMVGAGTFAAGTAAAADGTGPVATPPSSPKTQTVSGVAANGVQLSMTAPAQLPLDLPDQQLPEREIDVTATDVGGQGYTGAVTMTLTSEGSSASASSLRLDHYDQASGAWQPESIPSGGSSFTITDDVAVPANGTQVLKLRLSPGTKVVDDVKLSASANGATAVATMPVTGPSFQVTGLSGTARAGSPIVLTGSLTNPTDVSLSNVPVKLLLCSGGSAGCVSHASDVKVEAQSSTGAWRTVSVSDATATSPMSAMVVPQLALPAGGTAQFSVRVTVGAGAFGTPGQPSDQPTDQPTSQPSSTAAAQPVSVAVALNALGLTFDTQPTTSGTLTVQPPPQQPATPSTPSSTASSSTASATPSTTDSPTPTTTPTTTPSSAPTTTPTSSIEAASTPDAATASGNPTILVAAGLLAVCLALVLWWALMKRRERTAVAAAADGDAEAHDDEYGTEHGEQ